MDSWLVLCLAPHSSVAVSPAIFLPAGKAAGPLAPVAALAARPASCFALPITISSITGIASISSSYLAFALSLERSHCFYVGVWAKHACGLLLTQLQRLQYL